MVFLSLTIVVGSFVLEVGWVLDPALKINLETIYLFKLIFKFVYESYLLLNLCQIIYEFSLKYFKSYFVTIVIKLRCNKRNLSGSIQISIINTRFCKLLRFLRTLNKFYIHTYNIPRNVWRHSPKYKVRPIPRAPRIPFPVPVFLVLYIALLFIEMID